MQHEEETSHISRELELLPTYSHTVMNSLSSDNDQLVDSPQRQSRGREPSTKNLSTTLDPSSTSPPAPLRIKLSLSKPGSFTEIHSMHSSSGSPSIPPPAPAPPTPVPPPPPQQQMPRKRGRPRKNPLPPGAPPIHITRPHPMHKIRTKPTPHKKTFHRRRSSSTFSDAAVPPRKKQPRYPTFVPASVLSSDDLSASDLASSDPDSDPDHPPRDAPFERARVRKELLGNNQQGTHDHHSPWQNSVPPKHEANASSDNNQIIDVDADESNSSETDADEQESPADDEADDPDPTQLEPAIGADVSDSVSASESEDELDAQLFFNNLLEDGDSDTDANATDKDSVMLEVSPAQPDSTADTTITAHELIPDPSLTVHEAWDGGLVFNSDLIHSSFAIDIAFERSSSWSRERPIRPTLPPLATAFTTDESALSDTEADFDIDEDNEHRSEAGNTTDEDLPFTGVQDRPPHPPTPPTMSIDPFDMINSTPIKRNRISKPPSTPLVSPRPSDILANGRRRHNSLIWAHAPNVIGEINSPATTINTTTTTTNDEGATTSGGISTSSGSMRLPSRPRAPPRMGIFSPPGTMPRSRVIIDATSRVIPSPYSSAHTAHAMPRTEPNSPVRGRKRRASSDLEPFLNKRGRFPSLCAPFSSADPSYHPADLSSFASSSSPERNIPLGDLLPALPLQTFTFGELVPPPPPAEVIDLDEVVDSSLLDTDLTTDAEGAGAQSGVEATPSRFDRIPVGLYRHTRMNPSASSIEEITTARPHHHHHHHHHHHNPHSHHSTGGDVEEEMSFSFGIGGFGSFGVLMSPPTSRATVHPHAHHRGAFSLDSGISLWDNGFLTSPGVAAIGFGQGMVSAGERRRIERQRAQERAIEELEAAFLSPMDHAHNSHLINTGLGGEKTPTRRSPEIMSRKERRREKKRRAKGVIIGRGNMLTDTPEEMEFEESIIGG